MTERQITQEHGKAMGRDAQYMKSIGATDTQIKNWIDWNGQQVPQAHKQTYMIYARMGFTAKNTDFNHPVFNAYKARLAQAVQQNWACVRG